MRISVSALAIAALMITSSTHSALAQSIVRIEEDWELYVTEPDEELDAPQVTTTMLPFGSLNELVFQLDLNHAQTPQFSPGGLQLRISEGDRIIGSLRLLDGEQLDTDDELVAWTQVIQQGVGGYYYGVIRGSGSSFGSFGGDSSFLFVGSQDTGIVSLNGYHHSASVNNSGVTYAGNRVGWMRLHRLRIFNDLGQVTEWVLDQQVQ